MDPTRSFGERAAEYSAFRPGYSPEIVDRISTLTGGGRRRLDIADIGSGTGILSAQLLRAGHRVYAVEPDPKMRSVAERTLSGDADFVSVPGRAEDTQLADYSVDLVTAAQALHWFDPARSREEFARILRATGVIVAIWNEPSRNGAFHEDLDITLRAMHADIVGAHFPYDVSIPLIADRFFGASAYDRISAHHRHPLTEKEFIGRFMSSSFAPHLGHARYEHWRGCLGQLFHRHAIKDAVWMKYETVLVHGCVKRFI